MSLKPYEPPKNWVETSADCAPAVLGVAAGIILGDLMQRSARRPVAFALAVIGAAAAAPTVVEAVREKVAGPQTDRGAGRTLRRIRDGAGVPVGDIDYVEEELGEMYVG